MTIAVVAASSYPGDLAALLRVVYPEHFDAALASSAPLGAQLAHAGFFRVATQSFAAADARCPDIVRQAWVEILALLANQQSLLELQLRLSLCAEQSKARLLYLWVLNAFATLTMENYPFSLGDSAPYPMRTACRAAVESFAQNGDAVRRFDVCSRPDRLARWPQIGALGAAVGVVYNATGSETCFAIDPSQVRAAGGAVDWSGAQKRRRAPLHSFSTAPT